MDGGRWGMGSRGEAGGAASKGDWLGSAGSGWWELRCHSWLPFGGAGNQSGWRRSNPGHTSLLRLPSPPSAGPSRPVASHPRSPRPRSATCSFLEVSWHTALLALPALALALALALLALRAQRSAPLPRTRNDTTRSSSRPVPRALLNSGGPNLPALPRVGLSACSVSLTPA